MDMEQIKSCALVQPDIVSPAGRLSSGNVDFEFHFEEARNRNLMVKMTFVIPKVCKVQQANGPNHGAKVTIAQPF